MPDIVIHKSNLISDYDAVRHVATVIHKGRSIKYDGCYRPITEFTDGICVYADRKESDIFIVTKYRRNTDENQT